jgi:hypothetical protein
MNTICLIALIIYIAMFIPLFVAAVAMICLSIWQNIENSKKAKMLIEQSASGKSSGATL